MRIMRFLIIHKWRYLQNNKDDIMVFETSSIGHSDTLPGDLSGFILTAECGFFQRFLDQFKIV